LVTELPFIMPCLMRDGMKIVERGYRQHAAPGRRPLLAVRNTAPQLRT
jgi:hypothetical protein